MPEFLRLSTPQEALKLLLANLPDRHPASETVDTTASLGRVLVEDVKAPHPLPEFSRSSMDGFAVQAQDTFGASESSPVYLTNIGEVPMGKKPMFGVDPGTCSIIHTGGMLPENSNAVVILEYTQKIELSALSSESNTGGGVIEISHAVAQGENVIRIGEDVITNQVVLVTGTRVRPVEIGGSMALGILKMRVAIKPLIGIISTGNEIIPPFHHTYDAQVRDINSYSLAALVFGAGGEPVSYGIIPDDLVKLQAAASQALKECDALIITAGSSASSRDITSQAIAALGKPGILVHGVNLRPGKPTILAVCDGKAVIGLPGNPVSAFVVAGRILVPVIDKLLGLRSASLRPSVQAKLTVNVPSQAGREDWVAVKLIPAGEDHYLAEPVFGKSNLIFSLVKANGLVQIPPDVTGISSGELVEVVLI